MSYTANAIRILIVDADARVRARLRRILDGQSSAWTVVEASSGIQALERMAAELFDVALMDVWMSNMDGLKLIRCAHLRHLKLRILTLSMHEHQQYAVHAIRAGATGYVIKHRAAYELGEAIRTVVAGGSYVSPALTPLAELT